MAKELDIETHTEIVRLCQEGDSLANRHEFDKAVATYAEAWDLVPLPREEWSATLWILTAMADALFRKGDYHASRKAFCLAVTCPDGLGNPFIHLRLGEIAFELGDQARAADELTRAYMGAGREIFQAEDPKYFELLKDLLRPPIGRSEL